ncbi:uncharacterized protein RHIMIDRAFT_242245 [Rhizopus microsporus ATCC 52813]|uniref:Required for respiratory growth protein 9, mitochondrial n=1 Tax=Rhizopus microsporus ATCC 52813 TaxID=1340429 RepID=A0A2G4SHN3_RHIZD|nr:uncharacterized protein RHIMIDRAFT_242245 [Rhizopus microsporus ATCC 52813]PHZ07896.1 hypothetical protein RHIMIDRAFT_242245 [Rhizopus microsporus ATCC 52813]
MSLQSLLSRSIRTFVTNTNPAKPNWLPKKRVSRETMEKIRRCALQPDYNITKLSQEFKISGEAIRRILKSNYQPTPEDAKRQEKNRYKAMGERQRAFRTLGRK